MIKAIIFDCFGVLTTAPWSEFVGALPESQRDPARELNRAVDAGFITRDKFFDQVHQLTGRTPQAVEEVINANEGKNTTLLNYIAHLKKHYKIGLLSNISSDWITKQLLSREEAELFDDIVLSFQIRMVKPDPRAYELTAGRLGEQINECVFIDDSPSNCEGARAVGMQAIHYQNFEQMKLELDTILKSDL